MFRLLCFRRGSFSMSQVTGNMFRGTATGKQGQTYEKSEKPSKDQIPPTSRFPNKSPVPSVVFPSGVVFYVPGHGATCFETRRRENKTKHVRKMRNRVKTKIRRQAVFQITLVIGPSSSHPGSFSIQQPPGNAERRQKPGKQDHTCR